MTSEPMKLLQRHQPAFDLNLVRLIDLRETEITFAECFDAGRFLAADMVQDGWPHQFLLIKTRDGFGFAEVVGRTDNGRAILVPQATFEAPEPRRGPGRPPKSQE